MLPAELGCGSGMSCWRRLRDWHDAGVWAALHRVLLERLQAAGQIDWRGAALTAQPWSPNGDQETGPDPTDRSGLGTKHHLVIDARSTPVRPC